MPKYKPISAEKTIKILCNEFGFKITGQRGSHIRLAKDTQSGRVGTVIPNHKELKEGTLKGLLRLAKVDFDEFSKYY